MKKLTLFILFTMVCFVSSNYYQTAVAQSNHPPQPTIIFTPEVIEATRVANEKIVSIENSITAILANTKRQTELFNNSKCSPGSSDTGCIELKKQLQESYLEMLKSFGTVIPEMKRGLTTASNTLGQRIKSQIGRQKSPKDIMSTFATDRVGPMNRINRKNSIAARIGQYIKVLRNTTRRGTAPEVLGAEMYLDEKDALYNLSLLETEVAYQKQSLAIEISMGQFNEETILAAAGARDILFGEEEVPDYTDGDDGIQDGAHPRPDSPSGPLDDL